MFNVDIQKLTPIPTPTSTKQVYLSATNKESSKKKNNRENCTVNNRIGAVEIPGEHSKDRGITMVLHIAHRGYSI